MTLQGPAQWDQVRQDIRREGVCVWAAEREVSEGASCLDRAYMPNLKNLGAGRHCGEARPTEKMAGGRRQASSSFTFTFVLTIGLATLTTTQYNTATCSPHLMSLDHLPTMVMDRLPAQPVADWPAD